MDDEVWGEVVRLEDRRPRPEPQRDPTVGFVILFALAVPFWAVFLYGLYRLVVR